MKRCTKCQVEKELEEFYRLDTVTGRRRAQCKECSKEENAQYRKDNLEKVLAQDRRRYETHKEQHKQRRKENRERINKTQRRYREANRERINMQRQEKRACVRVEERYVKFPWKRGAT